MQYTMLITNEVSPSFLLTSFEITCTHMTPQTACRHYRVIRRESGTTCVIKTTLLTLHPPPIHILMFRLTDQQNARTSKLGS